MMTETKAQESFDAEAIYDKMISPLMAQIVALCKEHKIPVVASFNYANNEEAGPAFCTTFIDFPERRPPSFMEALRKVRPPPAPVLSMMITTRAEE